MYNTNSQTMFKSSMLKPRLEDYSYACVHVKETINIPNTGEAAAPNSRNTKVIFKKCAFFTDWISGINIRLVDNAKDIDVIMLTFHLIEYSDIYLKTSGTFLEYDIDQSALNSTGGIYDLPAKKN